MRFRKRAREELSPESIVLERFRTSSAPCGRSGLQGTGPIQSLTTKRGGQSRRRPSLWACSNASVQSWKKWLRSLNPKSRTMRSNVSKCSRRTLVVRLPCIIWVNSGSVFILAIQRRRCNGSTTFTRKASLPRAVTWTHCKAGVPNVSALDAWINQSVRKESILVLSARIFCERCGCHVRVTMVNSEYSCLISSKVTSLFSNRCSFCFPLPIFAAHLLNAGV